MDDKSLKETADILSMYSYKIDAITNLLLEKNLVTKDEINGKLDEVMELAKREPATDEYVIEELKDKVFLK